MITMFICLAVRDGMMRWGYGRGDVVSSKYICWFWWWQLISEASSPGNLVLEFALVLVVRLSSFEYAQLVLFTQKWSSISARKEARDPF